MPAYLDRRSSQEQSPINQSIILSPSQSRTLYAMEESGWHLLFIRQKNHWDAIPVLIEDESGKTAVIDKCGLIKTCRNMRFRKQETAPGMLH